MSERICIYPGSFDPPTLGHMDIIRRGSTLFDHLIVAVLRNPGKHYAFSLEERLDFLAKCCENLDKVQITAYDGLLADFYAETGACCVLRGVRNAADCDAELLLASANRSLRPGLETVLLPSEPMVSHISSSMVREVASFHGDLSRLVPVPILDAVRSHWDY